MTLVRIEKKTFSGAQQSKKKIALAGLALVAFGLSSQVLSASNNDANGHDQGGTKGYQYQASLLYANSHWPDVETKTVGAKFTYYLQAIGDVKGPLSEAEFLSKVDSVSFLAQDTKIDFDRYSNDFHFNLFTLKSRFIVDQNIIASLEYGTGDDESIKGLGLGRYFDSNLSVEIFYREKTRILASSDYLDVTETQLVYKKVVMDSDGTGSKLIASYGQENAKIALQNFETDTISVEYMYYTNITLGFGIVYTRKSGDNSKNTLKGLRVEWAQSNNIVWSLDGGNIDESKSFDFVGSTPGHKGNYGSLDLAYRF